MRVPPIVLALAACGSTAPPRATPALPDPLRADLDAQIGRAFARVAVVPGLTVAVYTRGGSYVHGFGVTDVTTREPVTADTAFYIASSTKSFTALAMAILADRHQLDLDATLAQLAPEAPFPSAVRPDAVRVRDLLTHTHGLANPAIGERVAMTGEHDPDTLWRLLAATQPNTKAPLGTFEYTNDGYNILTILTDRRLGTPWQDLLQREIFDPAGMTHTTARMSRAAGWSVARPHLALDAGPRRIELEKVDATMHSAGGIITSATDAARWLELVITDGELGGRRIVPAAVIRATRVPLARVGVAFQDYPRDSYGLGWYIGRYRDEVLVHQFGGFAGTQAHVSYVPARGVGVAVFTNVGGPPSDLIYAVANYVYDRTAGRADAAATLDAAVASIIARHAKEIAHVAAERAERAKRPWTLTRPRDAYAGTYKNDRFGTIEVAVRGDALEVRHGVMHAVAEPYKNPDSIRVELLPLRGEPIQFELDALVYQGERFVRR